VNDGGEEETIRSALFCTISNFDFEIGEPQASIQYVNIKHFDDI